MDILEEIKTESVYDKILSIVKRNPLFVFFVLSFSFTWTVNLLMVGLLKQEAYTYVLIAGFGPVLSAMFVTSVINPKSSDSKHSSKIFSFISVFFIAGTLRWISRIWWEHNLDWMIFLGDILLISLAALVISNAFSDKDSIRSLIKPYLNWQVSWKWYIIAIGIWPGITLAGYLLGKYIGISVPVFPSRPDVFLPISIIVSFLWAMLFNGALGEEAGWRGFALPILQQKYSPLIASIILGFIWGAFHWIIDLMSLSRNPSMFLVRFGFVALAILFTWLYNKTKGKSLLPVLLLHASMNATNDYLPRINFLVFILLGVVITVVIFTDRMWRFKPIKEIE